MHGITYNVANLFGGSMDHNVPLTKARHVLVETIHEHNVVLDVGGR